MRLVFAERLLLACALACPMIACLQIDAPLYAQCDTRCRYAQIWATDNGNGTYSCYNLQSTMDCWFCSGTAVTGGCNTKLFGGVCRPDSTMPEQYSRASNCSLVCPLPPLGRTQANATAGATWMPFGSVWGCYLPD